MRVLLLSVIFFGGLLRTNAAQADHSNRSIDLLASHIRIIQGKDLESFKTAAILALGDANLWCPSEGYNLRYIDHAGYPQISSILQFGSINIIKKSQEIELDLDAGVLNFIWTSAPGQKQVLILNMARNRDREAVTSVREEVRMRQHINRNNLENPSVDVAFVPVGGITCTARY